LGWTWGLRRFKNAFWGERGGGGGGLTAAAGDVG